MERLVKITNISHRSQSGSIGAWMANKFLDPGTSVVVPVASLPPDWQTMGTIFSFEFLDLLEPTPAPAPQIPTFDREDLKSLLKEVVGEHLASLPKPRELPPPPSLTKADLLEAISGLVINGATPATQISKDQPVDVFVPNIKGVEDIQISMDETKEKVGSLSSLKAKLRKSAGNPES